MKKLLLILSLIPFLAFSQTKAQKEAVYKGIQVFIRTKYIPNANPYTVPPNLDDFYKKSIFIPAGVLDYKNKSIAINPDRFYVLFENKVYPYIDKKTSLMFDSSFTRRLFELSAQKRVIVSYLYNSKTFKDGLFLTDDNLGFIEDFDGISYTAIDDYIPKKTGSLHKYIETIEIANKQSQLKSKDIIEAIKCNYHLYEVNCPKDTTLVLNKFIAQLKSAIGEFHPESELFLSKKIRFKLKYSRYGGFESKSKDFHPIYDLTIYGQDITDELLSVLTKKELIKYYEYKDIYQPIVFEGKNTRSIYGSEILKADGIINDAKGSVSDYIKTIMADQGCGKK